MSMPALELSSPSDEELAERREEAMRNEERALKAEADYTRQIEKEAQGHVPVMSMPERQRLADAVQTARQCRLAIETEQQRRKRQPLAQGDDRDSVPHLKPRTCSAVFQLRAMAR